MYIRHRNQILFGLVLNNRRQQVFKLSGITKEDLTFTVLHILLDVQCNSFCHTEILHSFRYGYTQFCTQVEEMVNSMTRCEDNCCVIQDRHFLLSEFFSRYTFHLNKRAKINFHTVLLGDVVVRRFL